MGEPAPDSGAAIVTLPPFGYRVVAPGEHDRRSPPIAVEEDERTITLRRGTLSLTVDRARGVIAQIAGPDFPAGALRADCPLADLEMTRAGQVERFGQVEVALKREPAPQIVVRRRGRGDAPRQAITITIALAPELDAIDITYSAAALPRPDGRMHAALQTTIAVDLPMFRLIHDHPYGVSELRAEGVYLRKYPTGDWMTSPQVFEEVRNPFTALQLLDFDGGERGLLYLHDGSQAMLRDGDRVRNILSMYDPWDEDHFDPQLEARVRLVPHGRLTHARRWCLAQEFARPALATRNERSGDPSSSTEPELPPQFGPVYRDAPNVAVSAFYRESEAATPAPGWASPMCCGWWSWTARRPLRMCASLAWSRRRTARTCWARASSRSRRPPSPRRRRA